MDRFDNRSFDRGAPFWKEALWRLCQGFFFQPLWPLPSGVRVFWLRVFGARVGRGMVLRAGVNIHFPWRFRAGDQVWIGEDVMILNLAPVELGSHVCVSQRAFLCTGNHDFRAERFDLRTAPIRVGDRSWVGAQAWVGPGVEIGPRAVVAAGAVVTRAVAAGRRVAGNPAADAGAGIADENPVA